jgi:alpha 1,3-glucosidase
VYSIPVYQRGGTIVPRKMRQRRASSLMKNDPFTLVVALNNVGEARGDVYADDYHSHGYRGGKYIHKQFTYSNGWLSSKSVDPNASYETKEWLERVIVLGVPSKPKSINIETEVTEPLEYKYDSATKVLVIRKPGVNIAQDFTIRLK